jgi:hypothetical protein
MRLVLGSIGVLLLGLLISASDVLGQAPKLVKLDLSKAGEVNEGKTKSVWKMTIQAPAGSKTQLILGGIRVSDDLDTFDVAIELAKPNKTIADEKNDMAKNPSTKKIIVDTKDTLVREFEFGIANKKLAYQFVKFKTIGDKTYVMNGGGRSGATKAQVDLMLKCADTLAPSK